VNPWIRTFKCPPSPLTWNPGSAPGLFCPIMARTHYLTRLKNFRIHENVIFPAEAIKIGITNLNDLTVVSDNQQCFTLS
jgi:hypothetical protein